MSKYITLLLAIALLLPVLAACGSGDDDDDTGTADEATPTTEAAAETTPTQASEEGTSGATSEATSEGTSEATSAATEEGTSEATSAATEEGTSEATSAATEEGTSEATSEGTSASGGGDMPGEGKTVKIGWIPWDEDIAMTYLWKNILEQKGYTVELTQLDAGTVFAGVAQGDLDVFYDVWLPTTHGQYWDQFGDQLEDLGVWYDQATLELAVPSYVDIDSMDQLADNADMFGSQIVGIEPGAGEMGIVRDDLMPTYGLDDWNLVEGSTPAMLAELERATNNEEPIIVTLWQPHWAYSAYDIKNLEDPENAWPEPEQLHVAGRTGFSDDFPTLAKWIGNSEIPKDKLFSLENMITQAGEGGEAQAVQDWLDKEGNQELVDGWMSGSSN